MQPAALLIPGHPQLDRPILVGAPPSALPIAGMPRRQPGSDFPTFQIGQLSASSTIAMIESLQPDVIVVACYPRLIPRAIRQLPRLVSKNVHPSILPAHRGPDPLFWIMRDGGDGFGVTIHALSDALDAGDILAQSAVLYPDGARERELELLLASVGAELVAEIVTSHKTGEPLRQRQDERSASYESWPTDGDYVISVNRPVRHGWNFVRGVAGRGLPIRIVDGSAEHVVSDAVQLVQGGSPPVTSNASEIVIRFSDGWLLALEHQPFND